MCVCVYMYVVYVTLFNFTLNISKQCVKFDLSTVASCFQTKLTQSEYNKSYIPYN